MLRIPRNIHSRSYTYARFHRQDKGRIAAIEKAVIPKVAQAAVQRRLSQLPLKQDLIHQLLQPGQGAETAAIAEIHQGQRTKRLEIGNDSSRHDHDA